MDNRASEFISATEKLETGRERLTAYLIDDASTDVALSGLRVVLQLESESARPARYYDLQNHTTRVVEGELAAAMNDGEAGADHEVHMSEANLSEKVQAFIAPHVGTSVMCYIPDNMFQHIPSIASELGVQAPSDYRPGTYI